MTLSWRIFSCCRNRGRLTCRFSKRGLSGPSKAAQGLPACQVIKIIRRHELLLGAIVFFAVLIVLLVQLTTTPIYQATATVQVELNDDSGSPDMAARNQQRVSNEAGIYRSRSLAEKVVQDLKLAYDPRFAGTPLPANAILDNRRLSRLAGRLMSSTSISSLKESDFIEITVRSESADLASEIANQYPASLAAYAQRSKGQAEIPNWIRRQTIKTDS